MSNPAAATTEKISLDCLVWFKPLNTIVAIKITKDKQAIKPYSSAITGNIKSVCASDIVFFIIPSPGPFPSIPPD